MAWSKRMCCRTCWALRIGKVITFGSPNVMGWVPTSCSTKTPKCCAMGSKVSILGLAVSPAAIRWTTGCCTPV